MVLLICPVNTVTKLFGRQGLEEVALDISPQALGGGVVKHIKQPLALMHLGDLRQAMPKQAIYMRTRGPREV